MGYKDRRREVLPKSKSGKKPIAYKHKYKNYKHFNPETVRQNYLYANRKAQDKEVDVDNNGNQN